MKPITRRLQALVLSLVFLGGGTSLPGLDVLLFHLHGERSRTTEHVEPAGGCTSHDGHCALAQSTGITGALDGYTADARLTPILVQTVPSHSWFLVIQTWSLGFQSRAPPVAHA
jgi:hypothetical protein